MEQVKLYMLLLGAYPPGRHIEQHDIFFSIAPSVKALVPEIKAYWPDAGERVHIDAYREVQKVGAYRVQVVPKGTELSASGVKLFFVNLGGYLPDTFDELHYKMLIAAVSEADAIREAKETAFYKHTGFGTAHSHIDDKYGVDVDDIFQIEEILSDDIKMKYSIQLLPDSTGGAEDSMELGYFKLSRL